MNGKLKQDPNVSAFLGIGTGKRIRAKAEAARILEEERRKTLSLQMEQAKAGFDPEKDKAAAAIKLEETKAAAAITQTNTDAGVSSTLYYVIGGIVIAVMVGLYFITRKS